MYDTNKVIIGLGLFAVVFGYPFYNNLLGGDYKEPVLAKAKGDTCVEDPEWMRANHMTLLNEWRHAVSRDGLRMYTSTTGKQYVASLQRTCMECHGTYDEFCKKCHAANSVNVFCWTCHIDPETAGGGIKAGAHGAAGPAASHAPAAEHGQEHAAAAAHGGHGGHGGIPGEYDGFKKPNPERLLPPTHDGTMRDGGKAGQGEENAHGADDHNEHGKEHNHE